MIKRHKYLGAKSMSHGYEMYSVGNKSIIMQLLFMVTNGNRTYQGDHLEMYRNIKSICCILETNIIL